MLKTSLCVGGPLAGQRKEILYGSAFEIAQIEPPPSIAALYLYPPEPMAERIIYRMEIFSTPQGEISCWVPQQQTSLESLTLLLETYMEAHSGKR